MAQPSAAASLEFALLLRRRSTGDALGRTDRRRAEPRDARVRKRGLWFLSGHERPDDPEFTWHGFADSGAEAFDAFERCWSQWLDWAGLEQVGMLTGRRRPKFSRRGPCSSAPRGSDTCRGSGRRSHPGQRDRSSGEDQRSNDCLEHDRVSVGCSGGRSPIPARL